MNVTNPTFTAKTAYTKQGNEYSKSNTFTKVGLGLALTSAATIAAYQNKDLLTKENGKKALNAVGTFFTETIPNLFKKTKAAEVAGEAAEMVREAAGEAAEAIAEEAPKKANKFRQLMESVTKPFKNIDYKALGKTAGKVAVYAAPVLALVGLGMLADKMINNKKAKEADLNA